MKFKSLGVAVLALGISHAAVAQTVPGDNIVLQWNEVTISNIMAVKPAPTVAARALAIVATAMYDAWAAYDALAVPTQPGNGNVRQTSGVTDAAKAQAISVAAYQAELNLFPTNTLPATALWASLGYSLADGSTPTLIGTNAVNAIVAARHNDGANQYGNLNASGQLVADHTVAAYTDYSGYTTPNTPTLIANPNDWQPLSVPVIVITGGVPVITGYTTQKYATPFFGAVVPFATLPAFTGAGPSRYPSFQYTADAMSALAYSAALNDTTKTIAEYWADFPGSQLPPGHWSRIGEAVSRRDGHSTDTDAQMFFALNNALMDAGISAWGVKRTFNSERPITAIHYLFNHKQVFAWAGPGKGAQWIDGGTWQPYQPANVITPAFAEYTSGHSTFSFAATAVLQRFTGSDNLGASVTIAAGSSTVEPGLTPSVPITLSFPTFSSAAEQAGLSRRYGGIHFTEGDLNGRADGYAVGQSDWSAATTYFNGGVPCVAGAPGQSVYCTTTFTGNTPQVLGKPGS